MSTSISMTRTPTPQLPTPLRWSVAVFGVVLGLTLWLSQMHHLFGWGDHASKNADALFAHQLALWNDASWASEQSRNRATNPEWDFMGRTFLTYALAERARTHPEERDRDLAQMDALIEQTLRDEREHGMFYFLMPYGRAKPFVVEPVRSQFLDGEIALMLAERRSVAEKLEYQPLLQERVRLMEQRMRQSPVLSAESYPDECWTFCNAIALAAIALSDQLDGTDHRSLLDGWVRVAKERLIDPKTGLLVSSYHLDGKSMDGPEGSSIWLVAHMLKAVDPEFARDQYQRAKSELAVEIDGFGFSREWPHSRPGSLDIDSGLVVPVIGASPSASGFALLAAQSFGDDAYLESLHRSLDFAAFPERTSTGELHYLASLPVGDAVLLYATTITPEWPALHMGAIR
jgi:hypothetical protein